MTRISQWTAAAAILAVFASAASAELSVGDAAPDFELKASDGKTYKLSEMQGKHVVVAWFPKAFTGGCTRECSSLRLAPIDQPLSIKLLNGKDVELPASKGSGLGAYDVKFFTASVDTPEMNKKYAAALKLDYPILCDPKKTTATAYGVVHPGRTVAERWTFYIGPDGKIQHIDKQVNAASHGRDIAAQLGKLGAPKK